MSVFAVTLLAACGAIRVWVESPETRVFPNTVPSSASVAEASIHAAQGERESFQICIRAGKKPVENISVEARGIGDSFPPPEIRRVGYISLPSPVARAVDMKGLSSQQQAAGAAEWFPDPLLDFTPFSLAPGETAAVWLTYDVPRDARPGNRQGVVVVKFGDKQKRNVKVSLDVFAFALPETPSLRTAISLNRSSIAAVYGLDNDSLEQWKPIYDAFVRERISFRLWEGGDLVSIPKEGPPDTGRFKEHLDYAVNAAHMNSIDVGAGSTGVAPWPPLPAGTLQDPMQYYLHDMGNWLQDRDWLDKAYIEPMPLPARTKWQPARDAYFRVKRNDKRIKRLLVGAGDPYFERYTEIWATPVAQFDPYADGLLRQGISLSFKQKPPAKVVSASSSGSPPGDRLYATQPEDAYDGCLFTYWISKDVPKKSAPQWLQIDLEKAVTTDKVKIIWKRGFESTNITIRTALEGSILDQSGMKWQPYPAASPFVQSWAEGTFPSAATFDTAYIEFADSFHQGTIGVTEVVFGEIPNMEPPEHIEPIDVWLTSAEGSFPSFSVRAHPIEARLMPWVCWGHQSEGFVHDGLCRWPKGWAALAKEQPLVWPVVGPRKVSGKRQEAERPATGPSGADFLFYPGRNGPIPSIRSEALRDGMEDYEYLVALDQLLSGGTTTLNDLRLPDVANVSARRLYPPDPSGPELDGLAAMVCKGRIRMGWAISQLAKKK